MNKKIVFPCLMLVSLLSGCNQSVTNSSNSEKNSDGKTSSTPSVESSGASASESIDSSQDEALRVEIKERFLSQANEVVISENQVTFMDNSGKTTPITIDKNPQKVANLYASFTTLWYEAGGIAAGCIGGSSSIELYQEYIGWDITTDENMTVLATTSSGSKWSTEDILALQPDLIICSTAMSGYKTISGPAEAASIPVIAVSYDDFSDYLKWFRIFSALTNREDLYESVALNALDKVVDVLMETKDLTGPNVFSMFSGTTSFQANTVNTVVGSMIEELHATNIVSSWNNESGATRLEINLEAVYAANPDMILIQCHSGEDDVRGLMNTIYGDSAIWNAIPAVKNDKLYFLQKTLFHNKPNSRFAEAYQQLATILYPDVTFSFSK